MRSHAILGVAFGAGAGTTLGLIIGGGGIDIGVAIGAAIGLAVGTILDARRGTHLRH
jgi:hypothetical protein